MVLPDYLSDFNRALSEFQMTFPKKSWSVEFRESLINDFSFYSARIEDSTLEYGDTIRFLNDETVRSVNLKSLFGVSEHQFVLKSLLDNIEDFKLNEEVIKKIHASLMGSPWSWETDFKPELVGQYRNIPTMGSRRPFWEDKEYAPHYNLEMIIANYVERIHLAFQDIDNETFDKHLLTRVAYFHNRFLNEIHPFADGNGRVCRIIIGALLMAHRCPPIFPPITNQQQQFEYIETIVACETQKSDTPMISYLAKGMTQYLIKRINEATKPDSQS